MRIFGFSFVTILAVVVSFYLGTKNPEILAKFKPA
jgi:hypothetical protein